MNDNFLKIRNLGDDEFTIVTTLPVEKRSLKHIHNDRSYTITEECLCADFFDADESIECYRSFEKLGGAKFVHYNSGSLHDNSLFSDTALMRTQDNDWHSPYTRIPRLWR